MRDAFHIAQSHGQDRLRPMEGLDLALFVDTQHQRVIRRVQIETYDIPYLLDEERIGGEFEAARTMRLQGKGLKEAMHGGLGDAADTSRFADRPVRTSGGLARK